MKLKLINFLLVIFILGSCQLEQHAETDPSRVQEESYKLIMYNQKEDGIDNIGILDRTIRYTTYEEKNAIEIIEEYTNHVSSILTKTVIDRTTLEPLYQEKSENDTLRITFSFNEDKIVKKVLVDTSEVQELLDKPMDAYISNSFSEIIQSHDFNKEPIFTFKTYIPGFSPGTFKTERIGEEKIQLPADLVLDTWILKFTRTSNTGEVIPAGFRYIDKKDGKVIAFKTDILAPVYFTYEMLLIN